MSESPHSTLLHPPEAPKVPKELVDELRQANAKFHEAREKLEHEMDLPEYQYQERVDQAAEEVRDAERKMEEAEAKLRPELNAAEKTPHTEAFRETDSDSTA